MRISHKRKKEEPKKTYLYNERIVAQTVFVLGQDGSALGVMKTNDAIRQAREEGLDLVEINPKAEPPVAKILNFGQFLYQQEKEARLRKAHQHVTKVKGVRLSLRICAHDTETRKTQAKEFLNNGDKVKVEIILKGREIQRWHMAMDIVRKFITDLNTEMPTRFDQNVERQGNVVSAIIAKT